jgi:hypothetical protein
MAPCQPGDVTVTKRESEVERPPGVSVGLHVCRGNQSSLWLAEGDYEPIAERLFGTLPVDHVRSSQNVQA